MSNSLSTVAVRKTEQWRIFRLVAMSLMLIAVTVGAISSPAEAAPPGFKGCSVIDNGRPYWSSDQYGRYIHATLKYRCNTGKEYSFLGTLYQNPDGQSGTEIGSIYHGGVATAPYVTGGFGQCDGVQNSRFTIAYSLTILTAHKYYQTPVYTLPCHYRASLVSIMAEAGSRVPSAPLADTVAPAR